MASKILSFFETIVKPTFTFSSVGNGTGRICSVVDNSTTRADKCYAFLQVKSGAAAPTVNTPTRVYVIGRSNDGTNDIPDGETSAQTLGTSDAAVSTAEPTDATLLGAIIWPATANHTRKKKFEVYDLPPKYGFVGWNATGQTTSTTAGDHDLQVLPVNPEAQ